MNIEEIYAIPTNRSGWRVLPNGNEVKLGNLVNLGNGVTLGNGVKLGNWVRLGDGVRLGNGVRLSKSPLSIQGTRHLACQTAPGVISIGCCTFTFDHWTKHVLGIAKKNGYTEKEGLEYQKIVAFIVENGIPAKGQSND